MELLFRSPSLSNSLFLSLSYPQVLAMWRAARDGLRLEAIQRVYWANSGACTRNDQIRRRDKYAESGRPIAQLLRPRGYGYQSYYFLYNLMEKLQEILISVCTLCFPSTMAQSHDPAGPGDPCQT